MNLEDFRRFMTTTPGPTVALGSLPAAQRRAVHARLTLQLSLRARHSRSHSSGGMVVA